MNLEQVAVCCRGEVEVRVLKKMYEEFGAKNWVEDKVKVKNLLDDSPIDEASLSFNYEILPGKEFEIITYNRGVNNWIFRRDSDSIYPTISHMGKHVESIKDEMNSGDYPYQIAQYVQTIEHSNPGLGSKRFKYLIFDSNRQIGFDLKLIERVKDATG